MLNYEESNLTCNIPNSSSEEKNSPESLTVADEVNSPLNRPYPVKTQKVKKCRAANPEDFHSNYLRTGLWPEMSFAKQQELRKEMRQLGRVNSPLSKFAKQPDATGFFSCRAKMCKSIQGPLLKRGKVSSVFQDRSGSVTISTERVPNLRARCESTNYGEQWKNSTSFVKHQRIIKDLSQGRLQTQTDCGESTGSPDPYKNGLRTALGVINTLIEELQKQESSPYIQVACSINNLNLQ